MRTYLLAFVHALVIGCATVFVVSVVLGVLFGILFHGFTQIELSAVTLFLVVWLGFLAAIFVASPISAKLLVRYVNDEGKLFELFSTICFMPILTFMLVGKPGPAMTQGLFWLDVVLVFVASFIFYWRTKSATENYLRSR